MYSIPKSKSYSLEYSFCQTDTFPDLDEEVQKAHGVCAVCAEDWLLAKKAGKSFVFSMATVTEKARRNDDSKHDYATLYKGDMAGMTLGNTSEITMDKAGGAVIDSVLRHSPYILLLVGGGLSRINTGSAHVLAVARTDGKYHMFDSNFGSYSSEIGVANWFDTIVNCVRKDKPANKQKYSQWARGVWIIPFK